ncbi:hypothetical protein F4561_002937 [Lipingzhangella halophila]|uniref:Uncharacterized protein n=1 Tax=Lipingzhangella halophila TaxID=1783352 RepID=A0A7W7RHK4_9ACTN|nr:hypothetical protein [Lipingzhangella halophila]MBB4932117.1 hypothetical protein [Lipingzhangella halophila]
MATHGSRDSRDTPAGGEHGGSHAGRWQSWLWVVVMVAGFTIAGAGLTLGPSWTLVAGGTAAFVIAGIAALATGIMADVVLDAPRVTAEETHGPLSRRRATSADAADSAPEDGDGPTG